jgi:hypothetical protein
LLDGTQFFFEINIKGGSGHFFLYRHVSVMIEGLMIDQMYQRRLIILKIFKPLIDSFSCINKSEDTV